MTIWTHHSEDYDGLPPDNIVIGAGETELDYSVNMLQTYLGHVARGDDVAWNASHAALFLQTGISRRAPRITEGQRDRLLEALILARPAILALFPSPGERELASRGVDAMAGLIFYWNEDDAQRSARHKHVYLDMRAYARRLRNACHNHCLLNEIRERAVERRSELVADMLRKAAA
ncbi:hypothetical protein SAMN05216228_100858 [Rhizobium tibeticum]|uniref:Uncharacterized protein n=1 Tax=Rhizobium tibeticum TaxID=501024 RepID=A0A1H8JTS5_9HYPH|nr:hypothetical protein [Rhizobium tibeticum]SEH79412.1 hypothetical protein RTCCBAU85039_2400 [Rhizobium tibeticum]SEN84153.1 hypothetical protein SAMN05216228_100858 [Rhizobium tibeticum]